MSLHAPIIGEIRLFAGYYVPEGWLPCDGRTLSRRENMMLFAVIQDAFGGDGKTTFRLPDLQGRVALGAGQGEGLQAYRLAEQGGASVVPLRPEELPPHRHSTRVNVNTPLNKAAKNPAGMVWARTSQGYLDQEPSPTKRLADGAIGPAGGGTPHENMQPYLVLRYLIAVRGVFPIGA